MHTRKLPRHPAGTQHCASDIESNTSEQRTNPMDPTISTPRLKLTLITKAERGSQELEWLHELRSDEKATWWSIYGRSTSLADTAKTMAGALPTASSESTYRVVYIVHRPPETSAQDQAPKLIGLITLKSLDAGTLALPAHFNPTPSTLTLELGYQFLPAAWGQGYATESLNAVFEACRRGRDFWRPFEKVYVRAIVNEGNPASSRVMEKTRMGKLGVYEWRGEKVWLAGEWTAWSSLHIFGMGLLE